jgi:hypothetical protein
MMYKALQVNSVQVMNSRVRWRLKYQKGKELKLVFKPNSINCEASSSQQKSLETLNCEPIMVKLD